jgi:tetratricopeptide (TPR) repeat protein
MRAATIVRLFTALLLGTAGGAAVGRAQSESDVAAEGEEKADPRVVQDEPAPQEAAPADGAERGGIDDERARAHFAAGESHYAARRFGDAAREFALAYELSRRPEMLVNLARAHERDGALRAAIADLELLLAQHPSTSYRGEAEERIARLRPALAAEEARAANEPASTAEPPHLATAVSPPPEHPRTLRVLGFSLAAGALATAAVALGTGLRAHELYLALEDQCSGGVCVGDFTDRRDRGRALARASTGLTFVSIALAAGAATTLLLDRRARRGTSLSLELSREHTALSLRRQF